MAPAGDRKNAALSAFLASRKNAYAVQSSPIYHSFLFCCDRFREIFKIPDFSVSDFDTALQLESENFRAGVKAINNSDLLIKLFTALGRPFAKTSINTDNYNEVLHNIFERKLVSEDQPNPLGESAESANIHSLPNEVKVYLMNFLIDLRIQRDESETVDKFCDPSALRVLDLGSDSFSNSYFYFGDFRLVVELKKEQNYPHQLDEMYTRNAAWTLYYNEYVSSCQFLIAAETKEHWVTLCNLLDSIGPTEKRMAKAISNLQTHELAAHLEQEQRRERKQLEELRALQKNEIQLRKECGLVRTSGRLQVKEKERKAKEDEDRKLKEEADRLATERAIANGTRLPSHVAAKAMTREERRQHREALQAEQLVYQEIKAISNLQFSQTNSRASMSQEETSNVDNCESSLSSLSSFSSLKRPAPSNEGSEEYEPPKKAPVIEEPIDRDSSSSSPVNSSSPKKEEDSECDQEDNPPTPSPPPQLKEEEEIKEEKEESESEAEGDDMIEALPFFAKPSYLCHLTIQRYYKLFAPRTRIRKQNEYRRALHTAQVLFASEFRQMKAKVDNQDESWEELENLLAKLEDPTGMTSHMDIMLELEMVVNSITQDRSKGAFVKGMLTFAQMSWDHLFPLISAEDTAAKKILGLLLQRVQSTV